MALERKELVNYAMNFISAGEYEDVGEADCLILEYLFENARIRIPEEREFFVEVNCGGIMHHILRKRAEQFASDFEQNGLERGIAALAYTGFRDFGHTSAEWKSVISLGIAGLRDRAADYREKYASDPRRAAYYSRVVRVYDAALRFMARAADAARECGREEMARGLYGLCKHAPSNLFEAMQTAFVYYSMQQMFDGTILRTLGRPDSLFYPFFVKEERERAEELVATFIKEADALKATANIPFALGGTDSEGNSLVNELSYLILDTYRKAKTSNVKLHLLCSENTPRDIIEAGLCAVREGNNSIVFMSDSKIIESLEKLGEAREDAVDYHVVGCYECGGDGEVTCSCNARVNIPKALELALCGGRDMLTGELIGLECEENYADFDSLYREFERQLTHLCSCAMKATDLCESHYRHIHSSPILSGTYTSALEAGGDVYCDYAAKYNNSSVNALGLATAVDSLAAIRRAVYEEELLTLGELVDILRSDWEGREPLRLLIKNKYPKFGTNDKKTDAFARSITDTLAREISGKPNVKGGVYRLGLFSIDWRWPFGERTGASADGRHAHDTISQNASATFGADKDGASSHLLSVTNIDASNTPNGTITDIDLHCSAVAGENGLKALCSTLLGYFKLGGFAVHYNILDTETLKDAKLHPEQYPNLQVRLCGWNVLFSTLSEREKDEFIARSQR